MDIFFIQNNGGVYARQNHVGTVSLADLRFLTRKSIKISVWRKKNVIIPFFIQYPLLGRKSQELERWVKLVEIIYTKKHIGDTTQARDAFWV